MPKPDAGLRTRLFITVGILLAGLVLLQATTRKEQALSSRPLRDLPLTFEAWQGVEQPLEPRIVKAVGVDDYVNRGYMDGSGNPVELYLGYYRSQRTGKLVHSPKNCLPGAGWEPVRSGHLSVEMAGRAPIVVNEYLIAKGVDRHLVLYWYQGRGRAVASEYWTKWYMVTDAVTRNRTDGALVRLFTPVVRGEESQARARLIAFLRLVYPHLREFIPE